MEEWREYKRKAERAERINAALQWAVVIFAGLFFGAVLRLAAIGWIAGSCPK